MFTQIFPLRKARQGDPWQKSKYSCHRIDFACCKLHHNYGCGLATLNGNNPHSVYLYGNCVIHDRSLIFFPQHKFHICGQKNLNYCVDSRQNACGFWRRMYLHRNLRDILPCKQGLTCMSVDRMLTGECSSGL